MIKKWISWCFDRTTTSNLLLALFITISYSAISQHNIQGTIIDETSNPIVYATISVLEVNKTTITNTNGQFSLELPKGNFTIEITSVGYQKRQLPIVIPNNSNTPLKITLKESNEALANVVVKAKNKAQKLREKAYAVEVIETKSFKNLSTNGNDILAKAPGINIRQSGGLGSRFNISLNGLSDNKVRMFIDGIPMDYFGSSLSLNNFSANLIEQLEIYKGVVPIQLSSDALGGAINVVTNGTEKSFLDASYSYGSFNTHIASINGQYRDKTTGFTTRVKSFYNYSDNNYKINLNLTEEGGTLNEDKTTEVERFHDGYESKMLWAETGFTKTRFADKLFIGVLYSENFKEIQQNEGVIQRPPDAYGEVNLKEEKVISNFSYSKNGFLTKHLSLNTYLVNVFSDQVYTDISNNRYDWFGNIKSGDPTTGEAETRKSLLTTHTDNILTNINGTYNLNKLHRLSFNYSLNNLKLSGNDAFNGENNTRYSSEPEMTKQVIGLSYDNSLFDNRFQGTLFGKYYDYASKTVEAQFFGELEDEIKGNKHYYGYGTAITHKLDFLQVKASYEKALRFPETIEILGDNPTGVDPNSFLKPETTDNYNLGIFTNNYFGDHKLSTSINGFIRDTKDFIQRNLRGIRAQFVNKRNVFTKGVDISTTYSSPNKKFIFNISGTYLDKRDNSTEGVNNTKDRIPNDPYLFGNAYIAYNKKNLFQEQDNFSTTINQSYVHEFFFKPESLGSEEKNIIPTQYTTDLEFVYSLQNQKYNFSLGLRNLFNAKVYDNLFQQKPGRTINFKLRYFIN